MKKRAYILIAVLLLNTTIFAQEKPAPPELSIHGNRITFKVPHYDEVIFPLDEPGLWPAIFKAHPELNESMRVLARQHIGAYEQAPDETYWEVRIDPWSFYTPPPYVWVDPSEGGGGELEPEWMFGPDTEKCRLAKSKTNALLVGMTLSYARTLVSCGSVIIPILGEVSVPICLWTTAATLILAWNIVNAADEQKIACREGQ